MREGTRPLVVAIDVGTSSARALLYAGHASRPLRHVRSTYRPSPDGSNVQTVDLYLEAVFHALDRLEAFLSAHGHRVDAVAISLFWHSVYVSGPAAHASPLARPLYLWNAADGRFASSAARLRGRLDADRVRQETGAPVHPSFPAGKALALLEPYPDRRKVTLQGLEAALAIALFGVCEVSVSMASATGLFDPVRSVWHPDVLDALDLRADQLPAVADAPDDVRYLRPQAARRWPHLAGARWHLPRGDGALSHLGLGASGGERWALTVGTSAALRCMDPWPSPSAAPRAREGQAGRADPADRADSAVLPRPLPRALFCYRLDGSTAVTGGALSAGGNLLTWVRRGLGPKAGGEAGTGRYSTLDAEERCAPPVLDGWAPIVVPHLWGERSPDWPDRAWGGVVGLTADTSEAWVERAAMHAIAASLGQVKDALRALLESEGKPQACVIRAGGRAITSSPDLQQMVADSTGLPVECPLGADEASARGAAALALQGLGYREGAPPGPEGATLRRTLPVAGRSEAYEALWCATQRLTKNLPVAVPGVIQEPEQEQDQGRHLESKSRRFPRE